MKLAILFGLLALATTVSARAAGETCSGKDCLDWPVRGGNSLVSALGDEPFLQDVSCKGQGTRCSSTDECCEGNDCMVGDHPYKTCGGG